MRFRITIDCPCCEGTGYKPKLSYNETGNGCSACGGGAIRKGKGKIDVILKEDGQFYYEHDANCSETQFSEVVDGVKTCLECAGIFDAEGKGIAATDKRFDAWRQGETNEV